MQCWFLGESPARPPAVAGGVGAFGVMFLLGDGGCRCPLPAALPTHVGAPLLCLRVCLLSVFAMVGTTVSSFGRSGGCFAVVAQPVWRMFCRYLFCSDGYLVVVGVLPWRILCCQRRFGQCGYFAASLPTDTWPSMVSSLADTLLPVSLWFWRMLCRQDRVAMADTLPPWVLRGSPPVDTLLPVLWMVVSSPWVDASPPRVSSYVGFHCVDVFVF